MQVNSPTVDVGEQVEWFHIGLITQLSLLFVVTGLLTVITEIV